MHVAHPKPNINIAPRPTSYLEVCPVAPLPSPDKLPRGGAAAATPLVRVRVGRRASSGDYVKVFLKNIKKLIFNNPLRFPSSLVNPGPLVVPSTTTPDLWAAEAPGARCAHHTRKKRATPDDIMSRGLRETYGPGMAGGRRIKQERDPFTGLRRGL